jgi:membrane associated rhomboid family serine protease
MVRMDGRPTPQLALPKPGRGLTVLLVIMSALGVATALLTTLGVPHAGILFALLACSPRHVLFAPWTLVTSGLITSPVSWSHLFFSLLGIYFLGAPLERRWGGWRFVLFLAAAVLVGNLVILAVSAVASDARFHPDLVYGPSAAIAAIAVAWSREYPDATVNLFFFLPVRARAFLWITLGFCVLDLIYPAAMPEGVVAPFGGVIAGLLMGGSPSLLRRAWLRFRLVVLRRRTGQLRAQDWLTPKPTRRSRPGAPPLRVVPGGLDDVLKNRTPPKDKRYLN